jgi:hypothetical protein
LKGIIIYKENGIFSSKKHFSFHHFKGVKKWGAYVEQQENNFEVKCCNLSLRVVTKARGYKVVGQKRSRESCHMFLRVQESVRE